MAFLDALSYFQANNFVYHFQMKSQGVYSSEVDASYPEVLDCVGRASSGPWNHGVSVRRDAVRIFSPRVDCTSRPSSLWETKNVRPKWNEMRYEDRGGHVDGPTLPAQLFPPLLSGLKTWTSNAWDRFS